MHQRTGLAVLAAFVLGFGAIYGLIQVYRVQATDVSVNPAPVVSVPQAPPQVGLATGDTMIGTVVTSDGRTVYRFDRDTATPSVSNCRDQCATTWPPVLAPDGAAPVITGVDPALVGTVQRRGGGVQVTLEGWPLYTYSGDSRPGEINGEGVAGVWKAIGVDGRPVTARSAAPVPGQESGEESPSPGY
jgi:predicted lipoprotein with Yx(FWY)xxD motif